MAKPSRSTPDISGHAAAAGQIGPTRAGKTAAYLAWLESYQRAHPLGSVFVRRNVVIVTPGPEVVAGEVLEHARPLTWITIHPGDRIDDEAAGCLSDSTPPL